MCVVPVNLDVPSIGFVYVGSEVISSFRMVRTGSQVFARLMLFLCVILHTMWSGKSLQLLCILPFGILCLYAIRMMFVKILFIGHSKHTHINRQTHTDEHTTHHTKIHRKLHQGTHGIHNIHEPHIK